MATKNSYAVLNYGVETVREGGLLGKSCVLRPDVAELFGRDANRIYQAFDMRYPANPAYRIAPITSSGLDYSEQVSVFADDVYVVGE